MVANYRTQNMDCCQAFAASYDISNLPAMLEIERTVLGCDYGGTSWTTREQAQQIVDLLGLSPGVHVLDIGAGSGWPGLFLADTSGCDVTLLDLPVNALSMARDRARNDGMADRVRTIAASGSALPFGRESFSAISHSDVLCCLPEKIAMLEECRRVATGHAQMLFSVIAVAPRLSQEDHRSAVDAGPPFVDAPGTYADMLSACGWRVLEHIDYSREHRDALSALVEALDGSTELVEELGDSVVADAREHRLQQIAVIDAGMLVREIFLVAAA